jgi:N-acetylglutamate synthase
LPTIRRKRGNVDLRRHLDSTATMTMARQVRTANLVARLLNATHDVLMVPGPGAAFRCEGRDEIDCRARPISVAGSWSTRVTDDEIVAEVQANLVKSNRDLAEHAPAGEYREIDSLAMKYTGVPAPGENAAFVVRPLRDPRSTIAEAMRYFDDRGVPYGILMLEGLDPAAERACVELGLAHVHTLPGMALAPMPLRVPSLPAALEIRVVRNAAEHDVYLQTDAAGFEGSLEQTRKVFPSSLITRPYAAEFLGFVDGVPVATSVLVATGRTAGVYGVATIPAWRRHGFGEAMTWHAVREGIARGREMANLQASEMGRPIYERMGFRVVAPFLIFARFAPRSALNKQRDEFALRTARKSIRAWWKKS